MQKYHKSIWVISCQWMAFMCYCFTRGGMCPLCICPLVMCCLAWGMDPIWKLSGPPAPDRMMAGRATEPVSTFPTLLNCCCSKVDLVLLEKKGTGQLLGSIKTVGVQFFLKKRLMNFLNYFLPLTKCQYLYMLNTIQHTHTLTFWVTQSLLAWLTLHLPQGQSGPCSFSVGLNQRWQGWPHRAFFNRRLAMGEHTRLQKIKFLRNANVRNMLRVNSLNGTFEDLHWVFLIT